MNNNFGNLLYELRKQKNLTQTQLAEALGVTNKAVSKWETGESFPETSQLVPLSKIFNITVDELLNGKINNLNTDEISDATEIKEAEELQSKYINESEKHQPQSWKNFFTIMMSVGVMLIIAGVTTVAVVAGLKISKEAVIYSVDAMLILLAFSIIIFCYVGILNDYLYLPNNDVNWSKNVKCFARAVAIATFILVSGITFFVSMPLVNKTSSSILLAVGIVVIAIAVLILCFFGMKWDNYYKNKNLKHYLKEENPEMDLNSKICSVVMMISIMAFLLVGFLMGKWHPGWIAILAGGFICAIVSILTIKKK